MNFTNKRIAVTGGAGFVGSHLVDRLAKEDPEEIMVLDDLSLGNVENLKEAFHALAFDKLKIFEVDLAFPADIDRVFDGLQPDIVFNLATTPLPQSLEDPAFSFVSNVAMTVNLCECQRRGNFETLIHFSSSEAFGSINENHITEEMFEDHPTWPTTPYAASKLAADHAVMSYKHTFGLDSVIVRPFNQYGPRQNAGRYAAIIPIMINKIIRGEPITIHGDGEQTRDFLYVEDTVRMVLSLCKHPRVGMAGCPINISSGMEVSMNTLVTELMQVAGKEVEVKYDDRRPGDVQRHVGGSMFLLDLLESGVEPMIDLDDGLRKTYNWYASRVM